MILATFGFLGWLSKKGPQLDRDMGARHKSPISITRCALVSTSSSWRMATPDLDNARVEVTPGFGVHLITIWAELYGCTQKASSTLGNWN